MSDKEEKRNSFTCYCGASFKTEAELDLHQESDHTEDFAFVAK